MKKILFPILILFCIYISGCSIPNTARYSQLHSFTKEEKIIKGGFGSKRKFVSIKDFRENEMFDEDIVSLKEEVEKYISTHPDLNELTKNNLRELKVTGGAAKEEVELLLGKPARIIKERNKTNSTSEIWIYRINKMNAFTIFIFPLFLAHEGYYLYLRDNTLTSIERHYLAQIIATSSPSYISPTKK